MKSIPNEDAIQFAVHGILLDIEGTTSSVAYVYDVLFPYARKELRDFLIENWDDADVERAREQLALEAGFESFAAWTQRCGARACEIALVAKEVDRLMDADVKSTGLKELQGLIWREGFTCGILKSHVYADVPAALKKWNEAGFDIRIYSSGSVRAQKLFFANTEYGDLTHDIKGNYDTTTGAKRESTSYSEIARSMQLEPSAVVFLSDVQAELDAAKEAGMQTVLVIRPGNEETVKPAHHWISSFDDLSLKLNTLSALT